MKILIPVVRTVITSPLAPGVAKGRIAESVDRKPSWWSILRGYSSDRRYFGRATRNGFVLVRGRAFVNTYRPVVALRFSPAANGTSVYVTAFAPGAILPPMLFTPGAVITVRNGQWDMLAGMVIVLLVLHVVSWFFFDYERRDVMRHLTGLLSDRVEAPAAK
jgi:hypothetical protein